MIIIVLVVFSIIGLTESSIDSVKVQQIRLSNKVRNHFLFGQQQQNLEINERQPSETWLANSNKLGLGYNPVAGDPVCYTGDCQMAGFGRSVFKFQYTNTPSGSCTTKLIPEHVEVSMEYYEYY